MNREEVSDSHHDRPSAKQVVKTQQFLGLWLAKWKVSDDEALKTVVSWQQAIRKLNRKSWTNDDSAPTALSENVVEEALFALQDGDTSGGVDSELLIEAIFDALKRYPVELGQAIEVFPEIHEIFKKDANAFWSRLGAYASRRSAGEQWRAGLLAWEVECVKHWIKQPYEREAQPPLCLWTDKTIKELLRVKNEATTIRKVITRNWGLYRPRNIAYAWECDRWVRKERWGSSKRDKSN